MEVIIEKKIALVKIIIGVIILYSLIFPLLSYFGSIPQNLLQNFMLLGFWVTGCASLFYLNKFPEKYKFIFNIILSIGLFISTVALINVPGDDFRMIWFYFIVVISFYIGGIKAGLVFSTAIFLVFLGYFLSAFNNIDTVSFITMIVSLLLMVQLSFYFTSNMESNERKIFNYQHNLESMVKDKISEIESLNEEIISTQQEVIYTLGAIGETRSQETGLHVKRVAKYSYILAKLSGIDEKDAFTLQLASPMHDIGKIGIEDAILNKPGKLTEQEFEIMKEHAMIGYEMLKHSQRDIFKTAAILALQHHEKYNGTGYPSGLKGEDIHIYGRITALADVFDALSNARKYKNAWKDEDVFNYLKAESGQHFDPKLITLFFDNLDVFLETREQFKD
jgi:response regulator RpfG family c-di-GMP phosphodiesterase